MVVCCYSGNMSIVFLAFSIRSGPQCKQWEYGCVCGDCFCHTQKRERAHVDTGQSHHMHGDVAGLTAFTTRSPLNGSPLQDSCLGDPTDRGAWQLQSMRSQRVGHDWATKPQWNQGVPGGSAVKNLLETMQETRVQSLVLEDPLEKQIAAHSSSLAWRIPWTESLTGYSPWGCKESDTT